MPRLAANLSMMFNEVPFLERFPAARKAGFEGVEFLFPYEYRAQELRSRLVGEGLTQVLFNMPPGDWAQGERGPFDWKGSFGSGQVTPEEWTALQARVKAAYEALLHLTPDPSEAPEDTAGGVAAAAAHVAYHLGAVRQLVKLL